MNTFVRVKSSRLYEELYSERDEVKIQSTMQSLREYCVMDTLAMVKILDELFRLVE